MPGAPSLSPAPGAKDAFAAFIDFSASPFALGDILTWNIRVCCEALNAGASRVDVSALTDPDMPRNGYQDFLTRGNQIKYFLDLMPAFHVSPLLGGLHHLRDRAAFERRIHAARMAGQQTFPTFLKYAEGVWTRKALFSGHQVMNDFFAANGTLPRLTPPAPAAAFARRLLDGLGQETFAVTVHVRRRVAEPGMTGGGKGRDGDFAVWETFFRQARAIHPRTRFLLLGRFSEWPARLMRDENVIILKTLGLGLMEELSLIAAADLFMGQASGPAAMAMFSARPYAVFLQQAYAQISSGFLGVPVGTRRLPFAAPGQNLFWTDPGPDQLLAAFEEALSRQADSPKDVRPVSAS